MNEAFLLTGTFVDKVVSVYRRESNNFGFIPKPRLQKDFDNGKFFTSDDGFVLVGSLSSDITPIHSVYIYPERRNGSTDKVVGLLGKLPKKKYRVRCHFGKTFWQRVGLELVRTEKSNARKREIYVLEGYLALRPVDATDGFKEDKWMEIDNQTFEERKANNFPVTWESVI